MKRKKKRRWLQTGLAAVCLGGLSMASGFTSQAGTLYESPYVNFSPDGFAWTVRESLPYTDYGYNYNYPNNIPQYWYGEGERITTGIGSTLRGLNEGERYYEYNRQGEVPVGYWQVEHPTGWCIHDSYDDVWHGVVDASNKCYRAYYSGWFAYCADCGGCISDALVYMSEDAARTITSVDVDLKYYYNCPSCGHIENTSDDVHHTCESISFNMYKVVYSKNVVNENEVGGWMEPSFHMYNNANVYKGERITPVTRLSRNVYRRNGYVFMGWNTAPDGSGTAYEDCAEILNLSVYDYEEDSVRGTVTLYAQWERAESTLRINPDGGAYEGRTSVTTLTKGYGETYYADPQKVTTPGGFRVSFQTNGGAALPSITAGTVFNGWRISEPLNGRFQENRYAFVGDDGTVDTLTATYQGIPIILPTPTRQGYSFGGWFADPGCTDPVGFGGDEYSPGQDTTVYAKWVELVLQSEENYVDNNRKGAVDLEWSQPDGQDKSYKLYESRDGTNFSLMYGAREVTDRDNTQQSFAYRGNSQVYTVRYSGFYNITAYGAQGGSHGSFVGGKGGSATMKVYLTAGERLTVTVGGQNGYNGGGNGTEYGNGGGATTIVSNLKGTLLIAGGGGGAGATGNGGEGGLEASLRADHASPGASGQAGGGAGQVGGNAGERVVHTCDESCFIQESLAYTFNDYQNNATVAAQFQGYSPDISSISQTGIGVGGHTHTYFSNAMDIKIGTRTNPIATNGNTTLSIPFYFYSWGDYGEIEEYAFHVYNQSGALLKSIELDYTRENSSNYIQHYWIEKEDSPYQVALPEGTTGIYMELYLKVTHNNSGQYPGAWVALNIGHLQFFGGMEDIRICGYEDGQILYSRPAYGGSNYVNTSHAVSYQNRAGVRNGNGTASIEADMVGFMNSLSLDGVAAPDRAAPDIIDAETVVIEADGDRAVRVSFEEPEDNGTTYWYKAESYIDGTNTLLCRSNITSETLTTNVRGYYYILDTTAYKTVTASNASNAGNPLRQTSVRVNMTDDRMYLHIAAVDVAGNVGPTRNIALDILDVAWNLATDQIEITDVINGRDYGTVYHKEGKTYYVRADGSGPFKLSYKSYLYGNARENYQIDHQIFNAVSSSGLEQRYSTRIPYSVPISSTANLSVSEFIREMTGSSILRDAMNTGANRNRDAKDNHFYQAFTLPGSLHGETIVVTPVAGSTHGQDVIYSEWTDDSTHSVTLIADGEAPVISGLEILENRELINRNDGTILLNVTALDTLSGVKDFYLRIHNTDNLSNHTYTPGADGSIQIEITKDEPIFSGDFFVTAYAVDNVGNETEITYGTTEFALTTEIRRILQPQDPVFKRGESGILTITTWGYAERVEVEFPEEFTRLNPDLNRTYIYDQLIQYRQEEQLQFMVPLEIPLNQQYTITVRAYKGDKQLEDYPSLSTIAVDGSVLDEIRTRLR